MGRCSICGQGAGLFRTVHKACKARLEQATHAIEAQLHEAINGARSLDAVVPWVRQTAQLGRLSPDRLRALLTQRWEGSVGDFLDDGLLDEREERLLLAYADAFGLSPEQLDVNGAYTRASIAGALRDLTQDKIPERFATQGDVPFNLQKSETLVWIFPRTEYLEERTHREYVGGYSGVSVRVARGLYFRTGGFRGHPVERVALEPRDTGLLGLTTKHVYFHGTSASFRVPYRKIVSFRAYDDGMGIQKDGARARPQIFVTGDGWGVYNLTRNLARLAAS